MRSATVVLVAVTVRSCNAFFICSSDSGFHKQPVRWVDPLWLWPESLLPQCLIKVKTLALPNDHFSSEGQIMRNDLGGISLQCPRYLKFGMWAILEPEPVSQWSFPYICWHCFYYPCSLETYAQGKMSSPTFFICQEDDSEICCFSLESALDVGKSMYKQ